VEVDSVEGQTRGQIAGFWSRLVALVVDLLFLGVVGWVIGAFLFDSLARLGMYGRLIGFAIALTYFGVLNSKIGHGQTLGKRLLGVRVVDRDGEPLPLLRSMLRYVVLGLPFFLNGAPIDTPSMPLAGSCVLALLVIGGTLSIIYMYTFNRRTRQSLHDLVVGSYVVRAEPVTVFVPPVSVWRGHIIVVALLAAISLSTPLLAGRLAQTESFAGLLALHAAVLNQPHVQSASVNFMKEFGHKDNTYVSSTIRLDAPMTDDKAFATKIARLMLASYPPARTSSGIVVNLVFGYDIGIASGWTSSSYRFKPDDDELR